jgi:outer membrane protein OmpA-like peptidoglycan-associated protein
MKNKTDRRKKTQMKNREFQFYTLFFAAVLIAAISGCASQKELLMAKEKVAEAEKNFETVESLNAKSTYPENFITAKTNLSEAKQYLEKNWLVKKAIPAAEKSLDASKTILKKYHSDVIAEKARQLRKTIEEKVGEDEDSPLKDYLSELDNVLDYAEKLESGKEDASVDKVLASLDVCIKTQDRIVSYTSDKLESDVSFDIGSYELSGKGIQNLEENVIRKIVADKESYKERYPDSIITLRITVVGYTDRVGFKNLSLIEELATGVENELPPKSQPEERRKFLNKRLSEFRARAINEHIKERILATETGNSHVKVEQEIIGKGEDSPPGIAPSNSVNDPQRRICKIYSIINYMAR